MPDTKSPENLTPELPETNSLSPATAAKKRGRPKKAKTENEVKEATASPVDEVISQPVAPLVVPVVKPVEVERISPFIKFEKDILPNVKSSDAKSEKNPAMAELEGFFDHAKVVAQKLDAVVPPPLPPIAKEVPPPLPQPVQASVANVQPKNNIQTDPSRMEFLDQLPPPKSSNSKVLGWGLVLLIGITLGTFGYYFGKSPTEILSLAQNYHSSDVNAAAPVLVPKSTLPPTPVPISHEDTPILTSEQIKEADASSASTSNEAATSSGVPSSSSVDPNPSASVQTPDSSAQSVTNAEPANPTPASATVSQTPIQSTVNPTQVASSTPSDSKSANDLPVEASVTTPSTPEVTIPAKVVVVPVKKKHPVPVVVTVTPTQPHSAPIVTLPAKPFYAQVTDLELTAGGDYMSTELAKLTPILNAFKPDQTILVYPSMSQKTYNGTTLTSYLATNYYGKDMKARLVKMGIPEDKIRVVPASELVGKDAIESKDYSYVRVALVNP